MDNFRFMASTDMYFGKGQIKELPALLEQYGKVVMLGYGGGSIKRNGIYDTVMQLLKEHAFEVVELADIEPNPHLETVIKGRDLCRKHHVDVILAVGGGSTIDCCKIISASVEYDGDPWDLCLDKTKIDTCLPLVTVLTMAATGSEMNKNAVITNTKTHEKIGGGTWKLIPKATIEDPTYLYTLPPMQTAAGTADIMSHVIEGYFKDCEDAFLQDRFAEGILKTCIKYCPIALADPCNYSARANLMWASSMALNGLCGSGKPGVWTCHPIEHELSAYYDITHGVGLAILTPQWMRYILNEQTVDTFCAYAKNVWDLPEQEDRFAYANAGIDTTEQFFKQCGLPMRLHEVGISDENFSIMAKEAVHFGNLAQAYVPLKEEDVVNILKMCQ